MAPPRPTPASIHAACANVHAAVDALKQQLADWTDLTDQIQRNIANAPSVVKVNVGGTIFQAFKDTFLRVEGSHFHALLGSGALRPDGPGDAYFLDLDPDIFRHVFKFLRTGTLWMDGLPPHERSQLKAMMEYLKLDETNNAPVVLQGDAAMHAPVLEQSNEPQIAERLPIRRANREALAATSPEESARRRPVDGRGHASPTGAGPPTEAAGSSPATSRRTLRRFCPKGDAIQRLGTRPLQGQQSEMCDAATATRRMRQMATYRALQNIRKREKRQLEAAARRAVHQA